MRFSMLYSEEQILSFKSCLVFYAGDSLSWNCLWNWLKLNLEVNTCLLSRILPPFFYCNFYNGDFCLMILYLVRLYGSWEWQSVSQTGQMVKKLEDVPNWCPLQYKVLEGTINEGHQRKPEAVRLELKIPVFLLFWNIYKNKTAKTSREVI